MSETSTETRSESSANWKLTALVVLLILGVAAGLVFLIFSTEPSAERAGATKKTAMLVEVVEAEKGAFQPQIMAQGTVEPSQDIILSPQIDGRIVELAPSFVPGGYIEEGDLVIRIEPEDYRHVLAQRQSELRQARSDLAVARGRHEAAQAEYEYIDEELSPENEDLVLQRPQLEAAKDRVAAAKAAVDQARLDLGRTSVEAPFDAHIISRDINVGSQVTSNDRIGRLVGIETYWVNVELPLHKLRWIEVAEGDNEGSSVRVRNDQAWPDETYRNGRLFRRVGALDERTRMARVLAEIPDPLARESENEGKPPLIIGEFVDVMIDGKELEDVVQLDRNYVREDDTVWVMEDGKLQIKEVDVLVRDGTYAYISEGLADGAQVVTTNISTPTEGAALRLGAAGPEESKDAESDAESDEGASDE